MHVVKFRSWVIWLTAGAFYLFEFIHRVALSVMLPELMNSFQVSLSAIGTLSACYFYAYSVAQVPVGLIIDRFGTRWILTMACLAVTLGSLLFALTSNIHVAEFSRILVGFGSAFAFVGCLKIGTAWFPARRFAFIVGLTNLLGLLGAIIGGKPTALAVDHYGWRPVLFFSAIIGLALSILLALVLCDPHKKTTHIKLKTSRLLKALANQQIWMAALFGGFMVAPIATYAELWGVAFLMQTYGLARPDAAQLSTLTFIGIAFGGPVIGWFSDRIRQRKAPMLYGAFGALACLLSILYMPYLPIWALTALHIAFGFFSSSMLLCFSLAAEATSNDIRATTIALTNTVIMAMGALMQSLSSYLLDWSQLHYNIAFLPLLACYILAIICYKFIQERQAPDAL